MTDDERKLLHAVEMGAGALRAIAVHEVLKERDRLAADLAGEAEGRRLANEALIVREHDLADAVCERDRLQNELHACREAKEQTEAALDVAIARAEKAEADYADEHRRHQTAAVERDDLRALAEKAKEDARMNVNHGQKLLEMLDCALAEPGEEHFIEEAERHARQLIADIDTAEERAEKAEAESARLHSEYATAYKEWQKTADAWKDRAEKAEADLSKAKAALGVAVRTIGRLAEDILADEVDAVIADDPPKGGA